MKAPRIAVVGVLGQMGREIARSIHEEQEMTLAFGIVPSEDPAVGQNLREALGLPMEAGGISGSLKDVIPEVDCVVEFTGRDATLGHLPLVREAGKPYVVGTTGFNPEDYDHFQEAAETIPIVLAPNMARGMNLFLSLVEASARGLKEFDGEVIEIHHRKKRDAPSGTAKKILEILKENRKIREVYGRQGAWGERSREEVGVFSIRAGDIPGEHMVLFAGPGERLELVHRTSSRLAYARGTVDAIRFVVQSPPGLYAMEDVFKFSG